MRDRSPARGLQLLREAAPMFYSVLVLLSLTWLPFRLPIGIGSITHPGLHPWEASLKAHAAASGAIFLGNFFRGRFALAAVPKDQAIDGLLAWRRRAPNFLLTHRAACLNGQL